MRDIARIERDFSKVDQRYLKYLSFDYKKDRIDRLKKAVIANATVLNKIVAEYQTLFEFDRLPNGLLAMKPMYIKPSDVVKMRSTIKSFLRDWSSQGQLERDMCYKPIMDEVRDYFPSPIDEKTGQRVSILHPGSGMGRLVFDFALQGYKS
jgi:carnosine N-methyltransferase